MTYPWMKCGKCQGYGLVHGYLGDPEDCRDCGGSGLERARDARGRYTTVADDPVSHGVPVKETNEWQTMDTAPRDGTPIIGWCIHEADPYFIDLEVDAHGNQRLTKYAAHCEGLGHVEDGPHVLVWGGGYTERDEYGGHSFAVPDWWFRRCSDFEEAANPVAWMAVPAFSVPVKEMGK